jgi:hypothetical protein
MRFEAAFAGQHEDPMASTPTRSASTTRGRRSGLVVAAAVMLALLGLLILLLDMSDHGLRAGPAVFCGLLFLAAVGLLWGRRVGYWFGLVMAAVLAALFVSSLVRRGIGIGSLVAAAIGLTPLALLLPTMRRSTRPDTDGSSPPDTDRSFPPDTVPAPAEGESLALAWPQGWTRPLARGLVMLGFMLIFAVLCIALGPIVIANSHGAERWAGLSITLFGLALAGTAPVFRPVSRGSHARLALETVDLGRRRERGVAFPYSRLRTSMTFLAGGAMSLAMAAALPGAEAFADDPGESPLWPRIIGVLGIAVFGLVAYVGARKGIGRRWRVVLTPAAVVFAQGKGLTVAPWDAIDEVRAFETTVYVRGFAIHEPFVGLILGDPQAATMGNIQRAFLRVNRRFGADISFPLRTLRVDPVLLYTAMRYYHLHPRARDELGAQAGLDSLRSATSAAPQPRDLESA